MTGLAVAELEAAGTCRSPNAASRPARPVTTRSHVVLTIIAMATSALAVVASGVATVVPIVTVAAIAVAVAISDWRSGVIPNGLVLAGLGIVIASVVPIGLIDHRAVPSLAADLLVGTGLSGAPVLFGVWLVAPRLIGGGDWKLLTVLGLAIGYLAPLAATVILLVAFSVGLVDAAIRRHRHVILGPPLAAGFVIAAVAAIVRPDLFGGWFQMEGLR